MIASILNTQLSQKEELKPILNIISHHMNINQKWQMQSIKLGNQLKTDSLINNYDLLA